jgi:hypothetical protein
MKVATLTPAKLPEIRKAIAAGTTIAITEGGKIIAEVRPKAVPAVTKAEARRILAELARADAADDWEDYVAWD